MTTPIPQALDDARRLVEFIDASPSPYHACRTAATALEAAGFTRLDERDGWPQGPGRRFVVRGGSLVAWVVGEGHRPGHSFRIVGAHTDSPNLRIKPRPDVGRAGFRQVAIDVYGSPLLNSWLDRDLGLSGRLVVRSADGPEERLVRIDTPLLRIPQLAIHLDREVNQTGLKLNPQQHLLPVWGTGETTQGAFTSLVAKCAGVESSDVVGWDLMTHVLERATLAGANDELISAPRLDNLCSSWAGLEALVTVADDASHRGPIPLVVLFDHEEVGSTSGEGAASTLLPSVIERIGLGLGAGREDMMRSLAGSVCLSADMAHATHPNYADRHEPGHWVELNRGPVLKVNSNLRYASDARSTAAFVLACEQADVPLQRYAHRTDLPCGSTIGPTTASRLGVPTVDVGAPQLAMHSARELAGSADPAMFTAALRAFLSPADGVR